MDLLSARYRAGLGLLLVACLVAGGAGCTEDLGLDDKAFSCVSDAECIAGYQCGTDGFCVANALVADIVADVADVVDEPDPCVDRKCNQEAQVQCEDDGTDYRVCGSDAQCAGLVWSVPMEACFIDGTCVAPGIVDPQNPCQSCQPGVAPNRFQDLDDEIPCDDGNACTVDTLCTAGVCGGGGTDPCDDGLDCTGTACDPVAGCQFPLTEGCLIAGKCEAAGAPSPVNPCQVCEPDSATEGWTSRDDGTTCDDEDVCTEGDSCQQGICANGEPVVCGDDGNPCTHDDCEPAGDAGCNYASVEAGTLCGETYANGEPICDGVQCISGCFAGYGNCNLDLADGCEVLTDGDPSHCGGCGLPCEADEVCLAGQCGDDCGDGLTNCGGWCADTGTSTDHCGGCDQPCPSGSTSQLAVCEVGSCNYGVCPPGTWDLDGDPADGCEYDCNPAVDEICDGEDNDCDGQTDEGELCSVETTDLAGTCEAGLCGSAACGEDAWNLDGLGGCETACTFESETDDCGGGDEDCDGDLDEDGVDCLPPDSAVAQVASGFEHACARRQDGTVWCWGSTGGCYEFGGSLGPISTAFSATPVQVPISQVSHLDSGRKFTCAVRGDEGAVWCWGKNSTHQLGAATPGKDCVGMPVEVLDLAGQPVLGAAQVAAGYDHACALMADGTLRCWGGSEYLDSLMGFGAKDYDDDGKPDYAHPAQSVLQEKDGESFEDVVAITAGHNFTCAVRGDKTAWCWGSGGTGQLGSGSYNAQPYPALVVDGAQLPLAGVVAMDAGYAHACARSGEGTLWCWGANEKGQLATGGTEASNFAIQPSGPFGAPLGQIVQFGLGWDHSCARNQEGTLSCWGRNDRGQTGNDTVTMLLSAEALGAFPDIVGLGGGEAHTCAWRKDGTAWCWGANSEGRLGLGAAPGPVLAPTEVLGLEGALEVAVGQRHACARTTNGVFCWGANYPSDPDNWGGNGGALGTGTSLPLPFPLHPVVTKDGAVLQGTDLSVGGYHGMVLVGDQSWRWGGGDQGQLGYGTGSQGNSPAAAAAQTDEGGALDGLVQHGAGGQHSCGLDGETARLFCQGRHKEGELGITWEPAPDGEALPPVLLEDGQQLTGVTALGLGRHHTCAVAGLLGAAFCWGDENFGQTGSGQDCNSCNAGSAVPVIHQDGSPLVGMASIAGGTGHTCALPVGGESLWCWGTDMDGQLGDGPGDPGGNKLTNPHPSQIGLPEPCTEVTAGDAHSCVRAVSGKIYCWGANDQGQLGDGTGTKRESPYLVSGIDDALHVAASTGGDTTCALHATGKVSCWGRGAEGQVGDGTFLRFAPSQVVGLETLCPEGFVDSNQNLSDGCEYLCTPSGDEICDGQVDEDCDGLTDEGFDLENDVAHCGDCGVVCDDPTVLTWTCDVGTCAVKGCAEGQLDMNGQSGDGCEYGCTVADDPTEICDGVDQDCDGVADDGAVCVSPSTSQISVCDGGGCVETDCPDDSWNLDGVGDCEYACTWKSDFDDCGGGDEDCDEDVDEDGVDCLPPESTVAEVTAGSSHTCARRQDGTVWCWGSQGGCTDSGGVIGPFAITYSATPLQNPLSQVTDLAAGAWANCAVRGGAGEVWCWGENGSRQLGADGDTPLSACVGEPIQAEDETGQALTGALQVAAGYDHACALFVDGTLRCWGGGPALGLVMGFGTKDYDGDGVWDWKHPPQTVLTAEDGAPFQGVTAVAAGSNFSCALRADQSIWCWGLGTYGRLGVGDLQGRAYPSPVVDGEGDALQGIVSIHAGDAHACALDGQGGLWCWGHNHLGQLATSGWQDAVHAIQPTAPFGAPLGTVTHVGGGWNHTCAQNDQGTVFCWGRNERGQTGQDYETAVLWAEVMGGITNVVGLTGGPEHTCAWKSDGTAWCWGDNRYGYLGAGFVPGPVLSPSEVEGLGGALEVAVGGRHGCARTADGVYCWGDNDPTTGGGGALGIGTRLSLPYPLHPVVGVDGAAIAGEQIQLGDRHSAALVGDQSWRWGNDYFLALGYHPSITAPPGVGYSLKAAPALDGQDPVTGLSAHSAGSDYSCALEDVTGRVLCNGRGDALGAGPEVDTTQDLVAVVLEEGGELLGATQVAAGVYHACALVGAGAVRCWGDRYYGQCGDGVSAAVGPVVVATAAVEVIHEDGTPLTGMSTLATGYVHSCALPPGGATMWCWGADTDGSLGDGPANGNFVAHPIEVTLPEPAAELVAGGCHSCMRTDDGKVYCWGCNGSGQVGDGTQLDRLSPYLVPGIDDGAQLAAYLESTCALHASGKVSCWGDGTLGQVGDNTLLRFAPTQVVGLDVLCPDGFVDTNDNLADGCEYLCTPSGDEVCDGQVDEDCDGLTDEGFDLENDVANCGDCGVVCDDPTVLDWSCQAGTCVAEICDDDQWDVNSDPGDGCEYACTPSVDPTEICDGVDDDCDGVADDGAVCVSPSMSQISVCDGGGCVETDCPDDTWNLDGVGDCEYACTWKSDFDDCGGGDEDCDGALDDDGVDCPLPDHAVVQMDGWEMNACALRQDGSVWCWGRNTNWVVDPTAPVTASHALPLQVDVGPATQVMISEALACARLEDATVWCWGSHYFGMRGDGLHTPGEPAPGPIDDNAVAAGVLSGVAAIFGGFHHVCALMQDDSSLWCWGDSSQDALGPGDGTQSSAYWTPTPVLWSEDGAPVTDVVDACAGMYHTCAVLSGDETTVWCWGDGAAMGDGIGDDSPVPQKVVGAFGQPLEGIVDLECHLAYHTCGRTAAGQVYCWGAGGNGKLGQGTTSASNTAAPLLGDVLGNPQPEPMVSLELDGASTCALGMSGALYCWGKNDEGLFLDPMKDVAEAHVPVELPGLFGVAGIAMGSTFQCVWHEGGGASCWGLNDVGQLGQGVLPVASYVPVVSHDIAASQVSLSSGHACAQIDGQVICWGQANSALGILNPYFNLAALNPPVPQSQEESDPLIATSIATGLETSLALLGNGTAVAWGLAHTWLGTGGLAGPWPSPILSSTTGQPLQDIGHLEAGGNLACAIESEQGAVYCWGNNTAGGVGCGDSCPTETNMATPVVEFTSQQALDGAVSVAPCRSGGSGYTHACAVRGADGSVWCWGHDTWGQLGDGTAGGTRDAAAPVIHTAAEGGGPLLGMAQVAAGMSATCALAQEGDAVWCWGDDAVGQLGNGDLPTALGAQEIPAFQGLVDPQFTELVAGHTHFCVLDSSGGGKVLCWGHGANGALGDGSGSNNETPFLVSNLEGVVSLFSGVWNTCAITSDGSLWCWGNNAHGMLGDGVYAMFEPQPVVDLDLPAE